MSESSYGLLLKVKNPADAGAYTQIAGVIEGELPKIKKDKYETKTLDQADRMKRYRGSFVDGGTLNFKIEFERSVYTDLKGMVIDPDPYPVQIVIPDEEDPDDSSTAEFDGLFEELGQPFDADGGRMVLDVTIQCTGPITFTEGTSPPPP